MSMPVSFLPIAPISPAGTGATGGSDGGAQFGAVLDSVTPRNSRTAKDSRDRDERDERDRRDDPRSGAEAASAAGVAPPPAAGSVPLAQPNGDAGTPAPAAGGPAPVVVPAPTSVATSVPPSMVDEATPPAAPSTMDTGGTPSTLEDPGTAAAGERSAGGDTGQGFGADAGSGRPHDSAAFAAVAPAARTDAAAASQASPVPQAPELPPAAQIALKLAPLRVGPDGTHQMTIHLNPEELGPISVVAQVRGGELSVQLTGSTEAGREALKEALPQLEQELRGDGFNTLALNVREAPRLEAAQRPAWAGGPGHTATDNATLGTGTTTAGGKTESQPIGQADQPDGFGQRHPARPDHLGTGMYNAAGQAVAATGQAAGHQAGQHTATGQQPGNQLNLGQPGGNQPGADQPNHAGHAEQQHGNGQRHGTDHHGGPERLPGRPETGERNQRSDGHPAEHRPTADRAMTRSVDLRV